MKSLVKLFVVAFFLFIVSSHQASAALTKTLKPGDKGDQVTQLQIFLMMTDFLPSGSDTGVYDATTTKAVKAFQKSVKLPQVGNVGPATKLKINGKLYSIALKRQQQ